MSQPANRLAQYRSYSYQHVLAICDSSYTASTLSTSNDENVWKHSTSTSGLGKYSPKQLAKQFQFTDTSTNKSYGSYCILINGMTDAAFSITSASWSATTAADAVTGVHATSVATEGTLQVSEPKGVVFLDTMFKCCGALNIDAASAVFVLKTFFVGYGHESGRGDYIDVISDVYPLQFIVYDAKGSFTEQGGIYTMDFVSCVNGAARLPQYSKSASAINITARETLADTLTALQANIQKNYEKYFKCVHDTMRQGLTAAGLSPQDVEISLRNLRPVKYVIEAPFYDDVNNKARYKVQSQPSYTKDKGTCDEPAKIHHQANTSIEAAIHDIMMMSDEVKKDMASGDVYDKKKYEFKIHSALMSVPVPKSPNSNPQSQAQTQARPSGPVEMEYQVLYKVERFMRPADVALNFSPMQNKDAEKDNPDIAANVIHFDYLYTGKNIDILEFDMKVNLGMAYLQTATVTNTYKSSLKKGADQSTQTSELSTAIMSSRGGIMVPIPILFGSEIHAPILRNTNNQGETVQAAYTLAKHASLEINDATIKIYGNPSLLNTINATTDPLNLQNNTIKLAKPSTYASYPNWGYVPAFAKIRIKMPRNNDDTALTRNSSGITSYAQDFWYDGYYYVCGMEHTFADGDFTQTLILIGVPQKDIFQSTKGSTPPELSFTGRINSCYDTPEGCGAVSYTQFKASRANTAPVNPTNAADAQAQNNGITDVSQVEGWSGAAPGTQQAIKNANLRRFPANIGSSEDQASGLIKLAQIAKIETNFGHQDDSVTGSTSAAGLYQITVPTWNTVLSGATPQIISDNFTRVNGVLSQADSHWYSDLLDKVKPLLRHNVNINADAGASLMYSNLTKMLDAWGVPNSTGGIDSGDVYMAHFLGVNAAIAIVQACVIGNENELVSTVYTTNPNGANDMGAVKYQRAAFSNEAIFSKFQTAGEMRTACALAMTNGVPLASITLDQAQSIYYVNKPPTSEAVAEEAKIRTSNDSLQKNTSCSDTAAAQDAKKQENCNSSNNKFQDNQAAPGGA